MKFWKNTGRKISINIGWSTEIFHCLKWKGKGGDFFDNWIFGADNFLFCIQIKSRRGNNRNFAGASGRIRKFFSACAEQ